MWCKWLSSRRRYRNNSDHPYEDLTKSSYELDINYKVFINLFMDTHMKTKYINLVIFTTFFSFLAIETYAKNTSLSK